VVLVPGEAVGAKGVPENVGLAESALEVTAVAMLLNSTSISVPLTTFSGSPVGRLSFEVKLVLFT
jgi:hypothetical protein